MRILRFTFHNLLVLIASCRYLRHASTAPLQLRSQTCHKAGVAILLVDPLSSGSHDAVLSSIAMSISDPNLQM